jgi:benzoyl-CoA reductase/2-hydroxyglutaryl-CoA dehydratase subunit BcrC/BadD/HgdB
MMGKEKWFDTVLKLCGWEPGEIESERKRLDEAFATIGFGPRDMEFAEGFIRENYDIELTGIRKALGAWLRAFIDLVLARKEEKKVIYYSFPSIGGLGFTSSLLGGEGCVCVCPEFTVELVMASIFDKIEHLMEVAEGAALPAGQAQCGLNKVRIGAMLRGTIPKPDALLASSFFCDQGAKTDEWIREVYEIPWVITDNVLDSPLSVFPAIEPWRVRYLGREIDQTLEDLLKLIGKVPTEEDWSHYDTLHARYIGLLHRINELMEADPVPVSQGSLQIIRLARAAINADHFPRMLDAMETLVKELEERVAKGQGVGIPGAPRVFGLLFPLRDTSLIRLVEDSGISVPITYMTYDAPFAPSGSSSALTLGEKRAEIELRRGTYHSTSGIIYWVRKACEDWNVDGVLWGWPIHCRPFVLTPFLLKKEIEEKLGIPVLSLEIDWWDKRTYSAEGMRTRIETFAQILAARKGMRR